MAPEQLPVLRRLASREIEEFSELVKSLNWRLRYLQLERGAFDAELLLFRLGTLELFRAQYTQGIRSQGELPPGRVTLALSFSEPELWRWHGQGLSSQTLALLKEGDGVDHIRWGGFQQGMVSFSFQELLTSAEEMGAASLVERLLSQESVLRPCPRENDHFRSFLRGLFERLQSPDFISLSPEAQSELVGAITLKTVSLLSTPAAVLRPLARYRLVRQTEALIADSPGPPPSLYEVCRRLQISERTLRYAFQEVLGVSPQAYLKIRRLNGARRQLALAVPGETTVTAVAHHWGFWHLGQFSRDYQRLFAELPSVTLGRFRGRDRQFAEF